MTKMNPEIKAKWVAALRSGKYEQGKNVLRPAGGKFCCLGVLCDLHAKESNGDWLHGSYHGDTRVLPTRVIEWSGLGDDNYNPRLRIDDSTQWASVHNDGGRTFAEIADAIEAQL